MKTDKCIKTGYNCGVKKDLTRRSGRHGAVSMCSAKPRQGHGNRLHGDVGTGDADKNKKAAVAELCLPTAA